MIGIESKCFKKDFEILKKIKWWSKMVNEDLCGRIVVKWKRDLKEMMINENYVYVKK